MRKLVSLLFTLTFLVSIYTVNQVNAAEKSKAQIRYEAAVKAQYPTLSGKHNKKQVYKFMDSRFRKGIMDEYIAFLDKAGKNSKGEQLYTLPQNCDNHLLIGWLLEWDKKKFLPGEKAPVVQYEKKKMDIPILL